MLVNGIMSPLPDSQGLNPYLYVMNTPTSFTDPSGMYVENGVWHQDPGCGWFSNWGACGLNAITTGENWYGSLSPEEKQIVGIGALAAITLATGGTDLLLIGAAGFGAGA